MSLMEQLTQVVVQQITPQATQKTGLDESVTKTMLPVAITALMTAMKNNAAKPEGAQALAKALDSHDGSLLNNLTQLGDDNVLADGKKILGHILGGKQAQTEQALASSAGVDQNQMSQLLAMAAPIVLASLGRAKREQGLGAADLAGLVTSESLQAQKIAPQAAQGLMSFLDQDGDGDIKDDLLNHAGKQLLGGLFGRK